MLFKVLLYSLNIISFHKRIRIMIRGKQEQFDIQFLFKGHIYGSKRSFLSGSIAIKKEYYIIGKTPDKPKLVFRKTCSRRSGHVFNTSLVHSQYIHIALDNDTFILLPDC